MKEPVVGKAMTFDEVIASAKKKQEELQARLAAMTPEERAAWEEEQRKNEAEAEKILKQLRVSPGFTEFKI